MPLASLGQVPLVLYGVNHLSNTPSPAADTLLNWIVTEVWEQRGRTVVQLSGRAQHAAV